MIDVTNLPSPSYGAYSIIQVYVKGAGKKFTVTESVKGKKIGKSIKVTARYANDPSYGGYSPAVTKKAKIKK